APRRQVMKSALCALGLAALLTWTVPCVAGIADSPLPELEAGKTTLHLYSVPGVIRAGGLGSFFSCTSTDTLPMTVGVELFGTAGGSPENDAVATSLIIPPGGTKAFGTDTAPQIVISSTLGGSGPNMS